MINIFQPKKASRLILLAFFVFIPFFVHAQAKFDTWYLTPHEVLRFRNNTVTLEKLSNQVTVYDVGNQGSSIIDSMGKLELIIDTRNIYDTLGNILSTHTTCSERGIGALLPFGKNKYIFFNTKCYQDTLKYTVISKSASNSIQWSNKKTLNVFMDSIKNKIEWQYFGTSIKSHGTSNCSGIRTFMKSASSIGIIRTDTSEASITFNFLQLSDLDAPNIGYLTVEGYNFSNDNKKLLVATERYINLYDYNDATTKTKLIKKIPIPNAIFTGVIVYITFSPNNNFVYIQGLDATDYYTKLLLYQLDLTTGNFREIYTTPDLQGGRGVLLGIDGKIYIKKAANLGQETISVIHKPDLPYPDCDYRENEILLSGNIYHPRLFSSLPNNLQNYYGRKYDFKISQTCIGDSVLFEGPKMATDDKYIWRFADGFTTTAPGVKRHISQEQKIHLRYNYCDVYDTAYVPPAKPLAISDTFLCAKNTLLLPPKTEAVLINNKTISGVVNDTFKVEILQRQAKPFGTDTVICHQTELMLQAKTPSDYSLRWSDNSNQKEVKVTESGRYSLIRSNRCFVDTSTINVTFVAPTDISKISNVITPNGDGINDTWLPAIEPVSNYERSIFNRWGTLVHQTTEISEPWTAQSQADGIYFWHISYTDCNNQTQSVKGTVMVVR
ncbi:MAG: gliding motility-associated C-terminal domain-containing protein [Sphingobacteriales bacterium]|nr:MAG: gliding motility-associated C-terminal domain-containing protein [Sphingobacteriales bacterium]